MGRHQDDHAHDPTEVYILLDFGAMKQVADYAETLGKKRFDEEVVAHEIGHGMAARFNQSARYALDDKEEDQFADYFACQEQKRVHTMFSASPQDAEATWFPCSHKGLGF